MNQKTSHSAGLSIGLIATSLSPSFGANLLVDGDFSLATSGTNTSNSPWSLVVNSPDGTNNSAQFQTGFANSENTGVGGSQAPGIGTGVWFRSFEGNQADSGEPLAQASLTQTVVAPISGDYELIFRAGREVNFTAGGYSVTISSSGTGGSSSVDLLAAVIPDGNLGGAASPNPQGTEFKLLLTGVTLGDNLTVTAAMVDGADSQIPGGQSGFLDRFSLDSVPEPSSAFLGLIGLLPLFRRRR